LLLPDLPSIMTDRLFLRPLTRNDAEPFFTMTNEPAILDSIHFLSSPFTVEDAERLIVSDRDGRDCFWGVSLRDNPTLLGTVGTHLRGDSALEIGYWFAAIARGRGLAAEAVRSIAETVAGTFPDRVIYAECRPENGASWHLLEKIGFVADGNEGKRPGRKKLVFEPRRA
jgi:RimJ/RimL family protein N-acetyltransferase